MARGLALGVEVVLVPAHARIQQADLRVRADRPKLALYTVRAGRAAIEQGQPPHTTATGLDAARAENETVERDLLQLDASGVRAGRLSKPPRRLHVCGCARAVVAL